MLVLIYNYARKPAILLCVWDVAPAILFCKSSETLIIGRSAKILQLMKSSGVGINMLLVKPLCKRYEC